MSDPTGLVGVRDAAEAFLRRVFLEPSTLTRADRVALLRPTDDDWAAVFGPKGEQARAVYAQMWASAPLPEPKPLQTELQVFTATPAMLTGENPVSERFPGGYREVAQHFDRFSTWCAFRYHEPGELTGMLYDGLVPRPGERWAWFPKPWRALR
ncbi:MAG: hypothetical protein R3F61_26155 [Myxococcota bacterium]